MTLKLEIDPELEAGWLARARARGLSLEAYLDQVLRIAAAVPSAVVPTEEAARA